MNSPPELTTVYQAVYSLYRNSDPTENKKAASWLDELQKSIYAWKISDEMLQEKRDPESCYFAAQTMRTKIQYYFHELPAESHISLRDSLLNHISQINEHTNSVIVTQLCLALADLALQMSSWEKPVTDLLNRFGRNANSLWPLLEIMKVLPEETNSLRLGANRRESILASLSSCADKIGDFLEVCLKTNEENIQIHTRVISCLTSWITIRATPLTTIIYSNVVSYTFRVLGNHMSNSQLHEAATDCVCAILQTLELASNVDACDSVLVPHFEPRLITSIMMLEQPYHLSVAHEQTDQSTNYCRIFTEAAETFLLTIVSGSMGNKRHYAIKILDLVLMCVGHHDYEVAQITFNFWYQLSEELYQKNNEELNNTFKPYIERLIGALCKHCQIEPDHLGLLEDDSVAEDFVLFRNRVSELIKDVVFIVGSSHCFRQMFTRLNGDPGPDGQPIRPATWDSVEASLYIMQAVAKNILPKEDKVVPEVVEAILNQSENTHIAVKHTSIILLGELCEWINNHPQSLEPVLNFLLTCLNQKGLASAASGALHSICTACPEQMAFHFPGLLQIARCLDNFPITNEAAIGLLKGISIIMVRLPFAEITNAMKELCWFQAKPLCDLIEATVAPINRGTKNDPIVWLDRLAAIFRYTNPRIEDTNLPHPCQAVVTEMWPILSNTCTRYQADAKIMERCCRCIRHAVRCIGQHAVHLLEPMVKQIVQLYAAHQHSCFLYLGSVMVDEYAADHDCAAGLVQMLEAFIGPTFTLLQQPDGLKNHPDTVDDLFRLCSRFLQRAPIAFLHSPARISIIDCALSACSLNHKDANASVMKFFFEMLRCGRNYDERSDFTIRRQLVQSVLREKGQTLVTNLLHAAVFSLSIYMLQDVADVFIELTLTDSTLTAKWLEEAIRSMPTQNAGGSPTATPEQLLEFHSTILRMTDSPKTVMHAVRTFARLFR
ncbi:transportin-3 [Chelonus insularis]|uniref:transportin-3 n=1 Tax=Chelonus insularis TaxID=460826 RepID=UPI00158E6CF3|nr:transportin-3 [Chelonus insularis]